MAVGLGALRERVRFDRRVPNSGDGFGNEQGAWRLAAGPMAAEIKPLGGREEVLAQRLARVSPYEIRIRWTPAAAAAATDADCRLVDESDQAEFDITDARNPDMRRHWLVITAVKGKAVG